MKRERNALFISDSHGCKKYIDYALLCAYTLNSQAIFHCGDIGMKILDWFAERTKGMKLFLVPGNHDNAGSLKEISESYSHIIYMDNEIVEYEGLTIVGKGLPRNTLMTKSYYSTLNKMLDEACSNPDNNVVLFTHYWNGKSQWDGTVLDIHGHKHCHRAWMYLWGECDNTEGLYMKEEEPKNKRLNSYNVALRVLLMPLGKDYKKVRYVTL